MDLTVAARGPDAASFVAFRSSCDRCRYMKLKCPSNSNDMHEPCERCSKAKVRCTYSRRTNLRRRTGAGQARTNASTSNNSLEAPEEQDSQTAVMDSVIDEQGIPTAADLELSCEPIDAFCSSISLDAVSVSDELLWTEWEVPSASTSSTVNNSGASSSISLQLWPNHPHPRPHVPQDMDIDGHDHLDSPAPATSTERERRASLSAQRTLSLANLAVELGECLQMLRGDHLRAQRSIDDYPIGHIRHLSQVFVASAQSSSALSAESFSTPPDPSTSLLLLSCYVSLRKLYIDGFSNIKDHLPTASDTPQQIASSSAVAYADPRIMRPRGMDVLGERCVRSYAAYNLTLDLLQNCDAALGLCAQCRSPSPSISKTFAEKTSISYGSNDGCADREGCIACALPAGSKKEAAEVFSAIADQECVLLEVIPVLRGALRQRMGLL